jgi:hypothetical protein
MARHANKITEAVSATRKQQEQKMDTKRFQKLCFFPDFMTTTTVDTKNLGVHCQNSKFSQ